MKEKGVPDKSQSNRCAPAQSKSSAPKLGRSNHGFRGLIPVPHILQDIQHEPVCRHSWIRCAPSRVRPDRPSWLAVRRHQDAQALFSWVRSKSRRARLFLEATEKTQNAGTAFACAAAPSIRSAAGRRIHLPITPEERCPGAGEHDA